MKLLLIASAVGPYGSGQTGGVSSALETTAKALSLLGHELTILLPEGSRLLGVGQVLHISGSFQPTIVEAENYDPIIPGSLLSNYWKYATKHSLSYDAIINFCHDWLPYDMTDRMPVPVFHRANVADELPLITDKIREVAERFPKQVAVLSSAQAVSLGIEAHSTIIGHALDLSDYPYGDQPVPNRVLWCGRISKEKGLRDAIMIAIEARKHLVVCGYMQDENYYRELKSEFPDEFEYRGFLTHESLVKEMMSAEALLCTHGWVEAFGLVVIEAMACGTPVITYDRGGPAEIVKPGITGWVIAADDRVAFARHLGQVDTLSRKDCRSHIVANYDIPAYAQRLSGWIKTI